MKARMAVVAVLVLVVSGMAMGAGPGSGPQITGTPAEVAGYLAGVPSVVTITGEAQEKAQADQVMVTVKVTTENESLKEALRKNQELRKRMGEALKEKGMAAERIKAARFSSTPEYGYFSEKVKNYKVENLVKITVESEEEFQVVANIIDGWSEVRYQGVEMEYSKRDELKKKLLGRACDEAMAKKKLYEEKLGVKLTAKSFRDTESGATTGEAPAMRGREAASYGLSKMSRSAAAEAEPASFGEMVFTAQISVECTLQGQ